MGLGLLKIQVGYYSLRVLAFNENAINSLVCDYALNWQNVYLFQTEAVMHTVTVIVQISFPVKINYDYTLPLEILGKKLSTLFKLMTVNAPNFFHSQRQLC